MAFYDTFNAKVVSCHTFCIQGSGPTLSLFKVVFGISSSDFLKVFQCVWLHFHPFAVHAVYLPFSVECVLFSFSLYSNL